MPSPSQYQFGYPGASSPSKYGYGYPGAPGGYQDASGTVYSPGLFPGAPSQKPDGGRNGYGDDMRYGPGDGPWNKPLADGRFTPLTSAPTSAYPLRMGYPAFTPKTFSLRGGGAATPSGIWSGTAWPRGGQPVTVGSPEWPDFPDTTTPTPPAGRLPRLVSRADFQTGGYGLGGQVARPIASFGSYGNPHGITIPASRPKPLPPFKM